MLGRDRDGFPARGLATFGEAVSSFNKGGNLASRRHGRTFLAQQTHLPTSASTIQDRTQNTNELDRDPLRCGAAPQPSRGSRTPSPWAPSRRPRSLPVTPRGYLASTSSTQRMAINGGAREWQPEASLSVAVCGSGDLGRTGERRNSSCGAVSAAEMLPGGPGHRCESHSAASRGLNAFRWTDGGSGGGYASSIATVAPHVPAEPPAVSDLKTTTTPRASGTDIFDRIDRNYDGVLTREEFVGGFGTEEAGLPSRGIAVSGTGLSGNASSRAWSATGHMQLSNSPGAPSPRAAWGGLASGAGTPKPLGDCPSPRSPLARSRAQLREPCAASLDCCTSISSGLRQPLLRTPQPMHLDGGGGASCSTAARASSTTRCASVANCASTNTTREYSPPAQGTEHSRAAIQLPFFSSTSDLLRGPGQQHGQQRRQQQQQQEPIVTTVAGGGDPRARSFIRLNGFLLRTHITSLVSALAEDGWLEAWEKEQLCHHAREGTPQWALAFLQVYTRFMEMDDVPMFVAGLRAQLA